MAIADLISPGAGPWADIPTFITFGLGIGAAAVAPGVTIDPRYTAMVRPQRAEVGVQPGRRAVAVVPGRTSTRV